MELTIAPKDILQIDNARIIYRNFAGAAGKFNREGDRSFSVVIPSEDIADELINNTNKYGVGWNVVTKPPREEGDTPFMHLKVKVKFNGFGPAIFLHTGNRQIRLDEESVACLDQIDISYVDLDIRPYDDEINGKPFRAAYLKELHVIQEVDRFTERYAMEEFPEE